MSSIRFWVGSSTGQASVFVVILVAELLFVTLSSFSIIYAASDVGVSPSQFTTAYSSQRKIVRNTAGELLAVYLKKVGESTQVYLAESSDNGNSWLDLAQISEGKFESVRAAIAVDSKDTLHVTWTKFLGSYGQIYYRTFSKGILSEELALTSGNAYSGFPSIAIDSTDKVHIVWYGYDGIAYQIYYTGYDGLLWSPPRQLSVGYPDSVNPSIAVDARDTLHVVWYKNDGKQYQIYYINRTRDWSDQIILSSGPTDSFNPSIAIDRNNVVHVVWDKQVEGFTQIFYSSLQEGGWTRPLKLTSGQRRAENPSVAIDESGSLYVFYERGDKEIYLTRYEGRWLDEQKITSDGGNSFPSARWSFFNNNSPRDGSIDLIWTHEDAQQFRIKYQRLQTERLPTNLPTRQILDACLFIIALVTVSAAVAVLIVWNRRRIRVRSNSSRKTDSF